ncbi:AAA family ATPase [Nocardia neocaledoniensis]|uniref:nucleotide-binding protein n=1 Tax=Nocardia neocaledoniensis TaxID=236511 RepID=UPI0024561D89|nr:AAA family ATPase [Nocardia neocaledoniensis]
MSRNNDSLPMLPPWLSESEVTQVGYEAPVENLPQDDLIDEAPKRRRFMGLGGNDDKKEKRGRRRKSEDQASEAQATPPTEQPGRRQSSWGADAANPPAHTDQRLPDHQSRQGQPPQSPGPQGSWPPHEQVRPDAGAASPQGTRPPVDPGPFSQAVPTGDPSAHGGFPQAGPTGDPSNEPTAGSAAPGPFSQSGTIGEDPSAPNPYSQSAPTGGHSAPGTSTGPTSADPLAGQPGLPAQGGPSLPTRTPGPPSNGFTPLGTNQRQLPDLPPPPPLPDPPARPRPTEAPPRLTDPSDTSTRPTTPADRADASSHPAGAWSMPDDAAAEMSGTDAVGPGTDRLTEGGPEQPRNPAASDSSSTGAVGSPTPNAPTTGGTTGSPDRVGRHSLNETGPQDSDVPVGAAPPSQSLTGSGTPGVSGTVGASASVPGDSATRTTPPSAATPSHGGTPNQGPAANSAPADGADRLSPSTGSAAQRPTPATGQVPTAAETRTPTADLPQSTAGTSTDAAPVGTASPHTGSARTSTGAPSTGSAHVGTGTPTTGATQANTGTPTTGPAQADTSTPTTGATQANTGAANTRPTQAGTGSANTGPAQAGSGVGEALAQGDYRTAYATGGSVGSPYSSGVPQQAPGPESQSPYATRTPAHPGAQYNSIPGDPSPGAGTQAPDAQTEMLRHDDPRLRAAQTQAPSGDYAQPGRHSTAGQPQSGYGSGEFAQPSAPHQPAASSPELPVQRPDGTWTHPVGSQSAQAASSPELPIQRPDGTWAYPSGSQSPQAASSPELPVQRPDGTWTNPVGSQSPQAASSPVQRPDGTWAHPDGSPAPPPNSAPQMQQLPDGTWVPVDGRQAPDGGAAQWNQQYQQPAPPHYQQPPGHGQWGATPQQHGYQPPSLDNVPVKRAKKTPGSGWRKAVHHVSGGAINPGMSAEERRLQELVARIRQPVRGDYRIAVLSLKGGVGKTTTTMGLGSIFSSIRGDRVIAVDANPDFGTLSQRVPLQTRSTVRDLLLDPAIQRYSDVRRHTSQGSSRLEVLASERDPAASEAFNDEEYRAVARILQRFYNIILTDCGTGLMHSAMSGVLDLAHSLVLISSAAIDGARSAAATLDWLSLHGHDHLVRNAVVVINLPREGSPNVGVQQLREYFLSRCRAVHIIPYDEHLSEGAEIDLHRLHKSTKRAYVELAATVADEFAVDHRRFG